MAKVGENWECSYCGHAQVITGERHYKTNSKIRAENWIDGHSGHSVEWIVCANNLCRKATLEFGLFQRKDIPHTHDFQIIGTPQRWKLLPPSSAKPYPDFIPEVLRRDYEEACAICTLSPKASATLTRRCIQGIIRDFCGIQLKDNRLVSEIKELRKLVNAGKSPTGVQIDTVDAIDAVREIGNIGAHMEADINVIVDVDPNEAQTLIQLTEMLFDEWYVEREKRKQRIGRIQAINADKKVAKKPTESVPS